MGLNPLTTTTKITDVIVPEIFNAYVVEKTAEKSKLLQSGIAVPNEKLNKLVTQGGLTMQMPYWQDLTGDDEVLRDDTALTPGKITSEKDIAALLIRGRAWGANDLAGALAGDDPMRAIGDRVADYWARREQKTLLAVLKGVFASTEMQDHVLDKSSVATGIDGKMVLDGKQLLGDAADQLTAMVMHSATFTELQKQNLIAYVSQTGPSGSSIQIPTYLGYRVVTDDGMPVDGVYTKTSDVAIDNTKTYYTYNSTTKKYEAVETPDVSDIGDYYELTGQVYTTYLFARGVIGRGEGTPVDFVNTETDRDALAGEDVLVTRRAFVLHPFGIKWIGTPASTTPSNEELADGQNWKRVYESKNIGIVAIKHLIP